MTDFNIEKLSNRVIDSKNINQSYILKQAKGKFEIVDAIKEGECRRCQSKEISSLTKTIKYCRSCLNLGRLDSTSKLLIFKNTVKFKKNIKYMTWSGELSEQQKMVSNDLMSNVYKYKRNLLWAVTGAGKTEILFNTINESLLNGDRIALISPRVDVCLELYPRFQSAFKNLSISLMHGQQEDKMECRQLTIATVHQMLKFQSAFDLIIVDEVDSYPLFGNEMLQNSILNALKNTGRIIYLSATPPQNILKDVEKIYYLPARYHGRPLPVPNLQYNVGHKKIYKKIKLLIEINQRFLMFFPSIKKLEKFYEEMKKEFPDLQSNYVSSEDDRRLEIVKDFRDEKIFALFTTTILERGVTFKNIDVIIYESDHKNFSKEVLIQIAGRADRNLESFNNSVIFYYSEYTNVIKNAVKEIKYLNKLAGELNCGV